MDAERRSSSYEKIVKLLEKIDILIIKDDNQHARCRNPSYAKNKKLETSLHIISNN